MSAGLELLYYLAAEGYKIKPPLFNLRIRVPGEYDRGETHLPGGVFPEARLQVSAAFRSCLRDKVELEFDGIEVSEGFIAQALDNATGLIDEFEELLNNFSAGQIYGIIWSGVTSAVRFHREKHPPAQNAAKAVITNCQKYGEKALIEKWNVKTFSRIKELPQSSFSKYLFNRVLRIGDDGFNMKPDINNIITDYQMDET